MNEYQLALQNFANFDGRSRRRDYWMFVLFNMIIAFVLAFIGSMGARAMGLPAAAAGGLSGLYNLFVLVPSIAVGVRRLHDVGKSGWWLFISLVPCIGFIWLIFLLASDSQPGPNEYGQNPKGF